MVLTDGQDRVLLVWRHRFVQDRWGWELPGGLVDEGEEPAGAAARELEEQTGYGAGQLVPLISFQAMAEIADSEHVVFAGRDAKRAGQAIAEEGIGHAEWVPLALVPGADLCRAGLEFCLGGRLAPVPGSGAIFRQRQVAGGSYCGAAS